MPSPSSASSGSLNTPVGLNGSPLTLRHVEAIARAGATVELTAEGSRRLATSRAALEQAMSDGEPHYGINTGFGSFSRQRISDADLRDLQRNLIRSHAAGIGAPLPKDVVRGMMLLLAASLTRGHSAVRPLVVERIVAMLNAHITPVVPSVGSCGASGDLAPLAHIALVLLGEGQAQVATEARVVSGGEALKAAGIPPLVLEAKEGLALINGTHLMAAQGALLALDFERLFHAAITASAMSIDACRATDSFLDPRVHEARCQPGQKRVAAAVLAMLQGSQILPSHAINDPRVQDPYSLRCVPQVLGAAWDAFEHVRSAVERELGAVTDNPLVFAGSGSDPEIISAGNFHGMPMAIVFDLLAISLCHVAGISERRIYHMLSAFDAEAKLPPYLSPGPGLHSGLMIAQYTAAACCNELIGLATPASVANLSTSAGVEDYNSFGPRAAAKARRGLELAGSVVAIELICSAEALDHHRPLRSGEAVERAHSAIRAVVPRLVADRPPAPDIAAVERMIQTGGASAFSSPF